MYFVISKIIFEDEATSYDGKELKALTEKLRSRFPICVRISDDYQKLGTPAIVIAALHPQEEAASRMLDQILEFCENSGFGRVAEEQTILEDLESALGSND